MGSEKNTAKDIEKRAIRFIARNKSFREMCLKTPISVDWMSEQLAAFAAKELAESALVRDLRRRVAGFELEKAIQQFTGYAAVVKGGANPLMDMVESMDLTAEEWSKIKEDVRWLPHRDFTELEEHFAVEALETAARDCDEIRDEYGERIWKSPEELEEGKDAGK